MPKIIIEFNLPEEKEELYDAQHGVDYSIALRDIDEHCRNKLKHVSLTSKEIEIYEEIRQAIRDSLDDVKL